MDTRKKEAFEEQLVSILNGGALALMISVGHRTRLFDAMAELPPSTSAGIAEAAGLDERYVREWLGAVVTGGIVEHDPEAGTFRLPPEHAALLTHAASPNNLAVFAQYVPLLGSVEDRIVDCFRRGGGVPYEAYGRFHAVMAEDSGQTVVAALTDYLLPLVPDVRDRLVAGIDVVDVGCGSGRAVNKLARLFPASRFTGYDLSPEAVEDARREASAARLENVTFEVRDAAELGLEEAFDLVTTFDAVHDQAEPDKVLRNIHRMLRPGGTYFMQDISASSHLHENADHPLGPLLYTLSCMHCMTVSLARGGAGLGAMWGRQKALELLTEAGFTGVEIQNLEHDVQNDYYVARKA